VFVVTFPKFRRAVDEMGCVYMTVDRRYYHVNEPGGEQYFEINLQPGYQRLCGQEALEFVANRHEDTSLTRDARDQRFLLEVKAQYGGTLFENREKFERILGRAVETDLHGASQVLDLLELLVQSEGKPVRQVPFHVTLLPTFDTATPQQIHESVQSFLGGTAAIPKRKLNQAVHSAHPRPHASGRAPALALTPTSGEALAHARSAAPQLPFPLEYPRVRDASAGAQPDTLRLYDMHDERRRGHPSYVIAVDRGGLGEFYDVQGTTWTDPPLLSDPSQTVQIGPRSYSLFYAGEQIRTIAWHEGGAAYWIQNTLTNSVQPREMLAMAEQTVPVINPDAGSRSSSTIGSLRGLNLPPRAVADTTLTSRLEAALGFAGLAAVALLALLVLSRQRELMLLREQVAQAMALEARQRPLLATAASIAQPEQPAPTIYRARKRWRGAILAAGALIAGLAGILAVHFLRGERLPSSTQSGASVPVAVFNASSSPGEAHRIADELKADRVHLGQIGNINASVGAGVYVLYPPGAKSQAVGVARLIANLSPKVEPLQAHVQNAVGQHDEIVVLFD